MLNGSLKKLLIFSVISYIVLVVLIFNIIKHMSYNYTFENLQDTLMNVKALRHFVSSEQKKEVYRLQNRDIISKEYFKAELLSSTYCSKAVNKQYNKIREKSNLEPVVIRFASNNPRNLKNKAKEFESEILKKFNDKSISTYKEIKYNENGKKVLYYAVPTRALVKKCMRCHSTPDLAPKEMVEKYGDKNGFFEKEGIIRALISTEYPLSDADNFIYKATFILSLISLIIFVIFLVLYIRFSNKLLKSNTELTDLNITLEDRVKEETLALKTSNEQLKKVQKELKQLVITDKLTGVYNRHKIDEVLENEKSRAERFDFVFGVIILDIDHFKSINDTYGHNVGDNVLEEFAMILKDNVRETDTLGRWGGEEFLIILSECDKESILNYAQRLRTIIKSYKFTTVGNVTASFGAALYCNNETIDSIITRADDALYISKNSGRDRVSFK